MKKHDAHRCAIAYVKRISNGAKRESGFSRAWFTYVAMHDRITGVAEKRKRNAARRYKRHLAREARVAKMLARVK